MSTLNLRPEFQLAGDLDSAHGVAAVEQAALDGHERDSTPLRGARRRLYGTRLLAPSDDGFHLFRVY